VDTLESVDAAYLAARTAGLDIVTTPRRWESDVLGYYGVQVRDRSGNLIEIAYRPCQVRP
jgi:hypothetical protein